MLEDSLAWIRIRNNLYGRGSSLENITSQPPLLCRREPKLNTLPEPELKIRIPAPDPAPFYLPQT
jgi:hypothetical protein